MELSDFNIIKDLGRIYPNDTSKEKKHYYLCKCPKCNNTFRVEKYNAIQKKSNRCYNCSYDGINSTHKKRFHPLYSTWIDMVQRCENKKSKAFKWYGARGIGISKGIRDINDFIKYVEKLENCLKDGYTLDRIDTNRNYEKGNLRFSTQSTQTRNTRRIHSHNTSGFRGVNFRKDRNKYRAYITINQKYVTLGSFTCKYQAAYTYDKYIRDNNLEHTVNFEPQNYILTPANIT